MSWGISHHTHELTSYGFKDWFHCTTLLCKHTFSLSLLCLLYFWSLLSRFCNCKATWKTLNHNDFKGGKGSSFVSYFCTVSSAAFLLQSESWMISGLIQKYIREICNIDALCTYILVHIHNHNWQEAYDFISIHIVILLIIIIIIFWF